MILGYVIIYCYLFCINIKKAKFYCSQLSDPKVRKMAELLEKTKSSYSPSYKSTFRDVVEGEDFLWEIYEVKQNSICVICLRQHKVEMCLC